MQRLAKSRAILTAKETVLFAILTALLLALQVALAPLPNIEVVSLLVVLYTLQFGPKTLFILYGFALLEGILYGFGMWFINYLYVWTVLWAVTMALRNMEGTWGWTLVLTAYGLCFGLLCSLPYLLIGGIDMAMSYFVSGIPFDLLHAAGNAVVAAVLFAPLRKLFLKLVTNALS